MKKNALQVLLSADELAARVKSLGQEISRDYQGQELVIISVLRGAFVFTADLIRQIEISLSVEFIGVSSYSGMHSSGQVRISNDLSCEIKGKHVLLIEDIIDTGKTMDFLLDLLKLREPKSVKICALLSKPEVHAMRHAIDYVGFELGNEFVVGYCLDYDGAYRELPFLAQLKL